EVPAKAKTRAVVPTSPFRSETVAAIVDGVAAATLVAGATAATTRSGRSRTIARALRLRKERVILRRWPRTSPFSDTVAAPCGEGTDRSVRTLRRRPDGEWTLTRTERSRLGGVQLGADGWIWSESSVPVGS